jgi:hypothetical protein
MVIAIALLIRPRSTCIDVSIRIVVEKCGVTAGAFHPTVQADFLIQRLSLASRFAVSLRGISVHGFF